MKVFMIYVQSTCDGCDDPETIRVFKNESDALRCFESIQKDIKERAQGDGWECESDDSSISTYEDGYYCMNHENAALRQIIVE